MKLRHGLPLICSLVCALAAVTARANLTLTNYTAAHPLKVLAIGDSITDDSVTNGAWRAYLEKLLVTNGYAFTNLGRWTSTPATGFTQVRHEGMDGSVIAPPGLSGPTHGYSAANNYSLLTVSNALTNATPDLVLIDMGVNDMGRGRNPQNVAMNDLSSLLDLIFTKLPSAHIIISKPTSITFSTLLSPQYKTYFMNMYSFCDGVQSLAAARRSQGQNVFVADLFSAVQAPGMLNGDGTHPNATGLSAIANEMMFRIAAITDRTNSVMTPFIFGGSVWKYFDQGLDLGANWSQTNFDDSAWYLGAARLGYNLAGINSSVSYGSDPSNKHITTYFRRQFVVPTGVSYTNLSLRLNYADGAVVWLNGQEIYRVNLPAGPINYQTLASQSTNEINDAANTYYPANVPVTSLSAGANVIAVEIHKSSPSGSAITFDLELFGNGIYPPPPTLSFIPTHGALQLAWPSSYTTFNLQSVGKFPHTGSWQLVPGPYPQSNGSFEVSIPINPGSNQFFRLIQTN